MAVDLMSFPKMDDQMAVQEAASQGLKGMEHLIRLLSHQSNNVDCTDLADLTVSKFKKVISLLNRTGHARFRRGPIQPLSSSSSPSTSSSASLSVPNSQNNLTLTSAAISTPATINTALVGTSVISPSSFVQSQPQSLTLDFTKPNLFGSNGKSTEMEFTKESFSVSSNSSFMKNRVKKVIRVPAISSKIADIPPDEYSWRKYGQKPIKCSPFPRGYYKCSSVRGCPARKHVERAPDDPSMLILTYEGEHRHTQPAKQENMAPAAGMDWSSSQRDNKQILI
ncbi:hypothetical protein Gotur_017126 [Gossypium turneri]